MPGANPDTPETGLLVSTLVEDKADPTDPWPKYPSRYPARSATHAFRPFEKTVSALVA